MRRWTSVTVPPIVVGAVPEPLDGLVAAERLLEQRGVRLGLVGQVGERRREHHGEHRGGEQQSEQRHQPPAEPRPVDDGDERGGPARAAARPARAGRSARRAGGWAATPTVSRRTTGEPNHGRLPVISPRATPTAFGRTGTIPGTNDGRRHPLGVGGAHDGVDRRRCRGW